MVVLLNSIYSGHLGSDKYETELEEPVKLVELLELLENTFPGLRNNSKISIEDRYAAQYLCICNGRILHLQDSISNRDIVELIPPIMGG